MYNYSSLILEPLKMGELFVKMAIKCCYKSCIDRALLKFTFATWWDYIIIIIIVIKLLALLASV